MRSLTGTLATLLVAGLVVGTSVAQASPTQRPATTAPRLELIAQTFSVDVDGTIRMRYRLTGVADDALEFLPRPVPTTTVPVEPPASLPPDAVTPDTVPPLPEPVELTLEVTNYAPLTDVDDIDEMVGSDVEPSAFANVVDGVAITDVRDLATVEPDGSVTLNISIGTDVSPSIEERLELDRPGLYPLRVQLLVGDTRDHVVVATAGTIVERLADKATTPPIDLSVLTVTPSTPPAPTPTELTAAQRALEDGIALAAGLDVPVTLEVPPRLMADATASPADAEDVAQALEGDELVSLPIVPLDVSAAVAAGRGNSFARLLSAGEDLLTSSVPSVPSQRDVWITTNPLSAGGAQELRDLGARFVVMTTDMYRETIGTPIPETDQFVEAELPDGGRLKLLLVGPLADQLLPREADSILADATATEWAVATLASLLIERDTDDQRLSAERSVVLSTPDLLPPDLRLLAGLQDLVATTPSFRFTPASALIGVTDTQRRNGTPVTVELPEVAGPSLVERVALIDATGLTMASAASMLPADDPRAAEWSATLDSLISTGYSDAAVEVAAAELVAEADALKGSVVLPDPFTFTLTGRTGPIEIRVGNTSDDVLTVLLELDSNKVAFPDGDRTISLRSRDETSVVVPVKARSNGTSSIELTVSTPAGEPLGEPVILTSRVTGFSGLGQVLMGGFILVLLTWWFTNWRSRRRTEVVDQGRERHRTTREVESDAL